MSRNGWLWTLTLAVWLVLTCAAEEESVEYTDCSAGAAAFGRAIAAVHLDRPAGYTRAADSCVVLCRTDDADPSFPPAGLRQVIRGPGGRFVLRYATAGQAAEAVAVLADTPAVRYAELDGAVSAAAEEGTAFHSSGAAHMGFAAYLPTVRAMQKGSVLVAVVDSGVSAHSMFEGRLRSGGYDYVDGDTDPTNDLNGHGTHVAGIVADCTAGTRTWLYPIRVLNSAASGKISNVAAAVLEAAEAHCAVINLSLCSHIASEALEDAIRSAILRGCVVVAAAGNDGEDVANVTPGRMTEAGILVVGAAEWGGNAPARAGYSNFGRTVDLYAYGTDISACSRSGGYVTQSGTSMAAAHISGACALIRLIWPELSPEQASARLCAIATPGSVNVPQIGSLAPETLGFSLSGVRMAAGDTLTLPAAVRPATAFADIAYTVSGGDAVSLSDGHILSAAHPGTVQVTAECAVWESRSFTVTVAEDGSAGLALPDVTALEAEAFAGTRFGRMVFSEKLAQIGDRALADNPVLRTVTLPGSALSIGEDILEGSGQAVILCPDDSPALAFAEAQGLQYIIMDE